MSDILRRRTDRELETESRRSPGIRLRWLRMRKGLTMADLADFLGCSVTEVSSIERGLSVHPDTSWSSSPDNDQATRPLDGRYDDAGGGDDDP